MCLKLETFGYIIVFFFGIINAVLICNYSHEMYKFWGQPCTVFVDNEDWNNIADRFSINDCESVKTFTWIALMITHIFFTVDFTALITFFFGIKKRNYKLVIPALCTEIFGIIVYVAYEGFVFSSAAVASITFTSVLSIVCLVIISTLLLEFKKNSNRISRIKDTEMKIMVPEQDPLMNTPQQ